MNNDQRLEDIESIRKTNRRTQIISLIGILLCATLVIKNAIQGEPGAAMASLCALMFASANYAANKSAECNAKTAIALHHENTELHRQLANAEEIKMYEIRDYNRKLAKYWEGNQ